ncbi:MAG: signal peptidase I [Planctomycetota bacterium]|nr:signal peptidase I [Planctomycetota bacterium]
MKEEQPQESRIRRIWSEWLKPFVIVLVVFSAMRSSLADWNDVPTQSMEPTILVGDRIAVNKLAYGLKVPFTTWHLAKWDAPERGEIIVFYSPKDDKRMVKRVIGLPGDQVTMVGNRLIINDEPVVIDEVTAAELDAFDLTDSVALQFALESLSETPHQVMFQPNRTARRSFAPLVVPDGQYLVMGDNRDNSADSRYFGFVPRERILGRVFGVALSLDIDDRYKPRWHRFFRGLD